MTAAYIIDACRTPRGLGKQGKGGLSQLHPQFLSATVMAALAERNDVETSEIDDIVWATSAQFGNQSCDLGRMAALTAGYDVKASALTLDRFCGSGITSVNLAAAQIASGMEDLIVAGGGEMMSYTTPVMSNPDEPLVFDRGNLLLREAHPQSHQGVCADAIATIEGIDRKAADSLAADSQQKAAKAIEENRFAKSLIDVKDPDGSIVLDKEEFPRPGTTAERLSQLKPVFDYWSDVAIDESGATYGDLIRVRYPELTTFNHIHHAGNSSGVVDGAAALLLCSERYAQKVGWTPRARVVATANMGDCPTLMLNAPVPAAQKVLSKAGLEIEDIDLWEINEAFAVVAEKFIRDLDLDRDRVNVNGGAIALGHPIGATGAILIGTILDELERQDKRFGLVTMCAAGGMAPAIIVERLN